MTKLHVPSTLLDGALGYPLPLSSAPAPNGQEIMARADAAPAYRIAAPEAHDGTFAPLLALLSQGEHESLPRAVVDDMDDVPAEFVDLTDTATPPSYGPATVSTPVQLRLPLRVADTGPELARVSPELSPMTRQALGPDASRMGFAGAWPSRHTAAPDVVRTTAVSDPVPARAMSLGQAAFSRDFFPVTRDAVVRTIASAGPSERGSAVATSQAQVAPAMWPATTDALTTSVVQQAAGPDRLHVEHSTPRSLVAALGERLHVQIHRGSEHAVIRLDPPEMGTIEIVIHREAGGVQVHLSASNGEVLRQLHGISDALRQDMVQRNHGDVTVHVWDDSRDPDGRHRQRHALPEKDAPGRALSEAGEDAGSGTFQFA